jgi:hypothetical protein
MVNSGRRSTAASGIPLWMPPPPRMAPPVRGPAPNRPQQFVMPHLVGEGSHESGGGAEEIGVPLHRRQVVPPSGVGGQSLQEVFVDGIDEEEEEHFCGKSSSLVIGLLLLFCGRLTISRCITSS